MAVLRYFRTVGSVIERQIDLLARQRSISPENARKSVVEQVARNSNEWRARRQPRIEYHDPFCRAAYMYSIVGANANLVELALENSKELGDHIDHVLEERGELNVCAFGGGPGTELLAMAKWFEKRKLADEISETAHLNFLLLDRVNNWLESWRAIQRHINTVFRDEYSKDLPVRVTGNFCAVDITDAASLTDLGDVFDQDLFIMSYVVSEIFDDVEALRSFTAHMANHAAAGAKFLFVDRDEPRWRTEVENIAAAAGLRLSEFRHSRRNMSDDEQVKHLGSILDDVLRLGGRNPRVQWTAFWAVATKE